MSRSRPLFGLLLAAVAGTFLGACELTDFDPFGQTTEEILEGERISVLAHLRSLSPDEDAQDHQILLPAPSPNEAWPMAGGYANHAMHHMAVGERLSRAWSVDIGSGTDDEMRFVATPVVADGRVFAMDTESTVSAYDVAEGDRLWEVDLEPEEDDDGHIGGGLAYAKGIVYVATGFAEIIALRAETGDVVWRQKVSGPMRAAPTVRGGRVYVVTLDNKLFALNAADGSALWTHSGVAEPASLLGSASPAVDAGVVVVAYTSGELVALKVETGRVLWQDSLASLRRTDVISTLSHIRGRPIIDRGRVFAISHAGIMVAIDLRSGRRIWEREIGGAESPWVAGDYLFVLTNDMEVAALHRERGAILWVRGLPRFEDPEDRDDPISWSGPVLAGDRLLVTGTNGQALAVSPYSGRILGSVELPDGVAVPPVIAAGTVFFLADDAELVAYR